MGAPVAIPDGIARLATLEAVTRWAFAQQPPLELLEVVTQDEYTHDIVIAWRDGLHLVFDTT